MVADLLEKVSRIPHQVFELVRLFVGRLISVVGNVVFYFFFFFF